MDPLFLLIVGGSICYSLHIVLIARVVRRSPGSTASGALHPLIAMGATHVIGGALLSLLLLSGLAPEGSGPAPREFYLLTALAALLHLGSKACHFMALQVEDVAVVGAFSALSPVLAIVSAWMMLNEVPTKEGAAGIAIVVLSLVTLQVSGRRTHACDRPQERQRRGLLRSGIFLAFLSAVIPSLGIVVGKMAILSAHPLLYTHHALWLAGLGSIAICWRSQGAERLSESLRSSSMSTLFLSSALMAASVAQFSAALVHDVAAHVSAMTRLTIPLQVVLGYVLAGQRERFGVRLWWSTVLLSGVVVIALGRAPAP